MSQIKQTEIDPDLLTTVIEQQVDAGSDFDGAAPADATENFVPYYDEDDGVFRWGKPDGTTFVGTHGGLFDMTHKQPIVLEQLFADFGGSVTWNIYIVTARGDVLIKTGTGQYLAYGNGELRWRMQRHEKVKVTTSGGSAAMWLRIYVRSEQAISV